ncbi:MAG: FAD binding domain-containing protein [Melioribacter sp.]|nr:FAD binding domain-containing protein [Melioribacter sp.]
MEKLISFYCNNELLSVQINPAITLLDFLRNHKKLTGTKEGCREGDCGACTVMLGSLIKGKVKFKTVNSCLMPIADVSGKHVVSIEGLNNNELNFLQSQFIDEGGTQCGFCTPGFIVSLTNYFVNHISYNVEDAIASLDGNICRCTGYVGIKRAVQNTINYLDGGNSTNHNPVNHLITKKILPPYFSELPKKLKQLQNKTGSSLKQKGNKLNIVSGGTDIFVQKWESLLEEDNYFVSDDTGLKLISKKQNKIFIGGAVTVEEFLESKIIQKYFPFLKEHLRLFGSLPIRNRATIAGNIVNASPIGDMTNILLALSANVHLKDKNKKRVVPLNKFYLGYKTLNKKKNELVEQVSIPIPGKNFLFNYEKVSRRTYLDIASVNSSILIAVQNGKIKEALISAGGVAPIPLFLKSTSKFLSGKELSSSTVNHSIEIAKSEISPISDARGSKEYKTLLLGQLIKAHFIKLFPELNVDEVLK